MSAGIVLRIKNGKLAGKSFNSVPAAPIRSAEAPDCEVCLPSEPEFAMVSRHHCAVVAGPDRVQVQDRGSRNGTHLNGMQIGRPVEWQLSRRLQARPCQAYDVADGDAFQIGETMFEVWCLEQAENHEVLCARHRERAGSVHVRLEWLTKRGRAPRAAVPVPILLDAPSGSRPPMSQAISLSALPRSACRRRREVLAWLERNTRNHDQPGPSAPPVEFLGQSEQRTGLDVVVQGWRRRARLQFLHIRAGSFHTRINKNRLPCLGQCRRQLRRQLLDHPALDSR